MSDLLEVPPPRPLPPAVRDAQSRLLAEIVGRRRPRWRSRFVIFPAALVLAGGGVAAAVRASLGEVTDRDTARCYSVAERHDGRDFPGTSVAVAHPDSDVVGQVEDAVATCALVWRDGALEIGKRRAQPYRPGVDRPVPSLVGCVLPDGSAAVFPGDAQTCSRLGLPAVSN